MENIDLHTHTKCSDGLLSSYELIDKAYSYGLKALSICDHDTIKAYEDVNIFDYAKQKGIELIPGIELSTVDSLGKKYHILGYLIDLKNKNLLKNIEEIQKRRVSYVNSVSEVLKKDGWYINTEELLSDGDSITKAHISRALIKDIRNSDNIKILFSHIPSEGEVTEALLIKGKKYFVSKGESLSSEKAIEIIHKAGGVSILAHPSFNVMNGESLEELCEKFINIGIDGFEAICIQFNKSNEDKRIDYVDQFNDYAKKYNMLITGGSDYHHSNKSLMGNFIDLGFNGDEYKVPIDILNKLKDYKNKKIA